MHKNWVIKGYEQSVTCLADDRKTLEIRSSKLRTPETLSWTNNSIHKHSIMKTQRKLKKKILTESLGHELRYAKKINKIGIKKLKLQSKKFQIQICLKPNFKISKYV